MILSKCRIIEADQSKLPKGVLCRGVWPICNVGQLNQNNRVYEKAVFEKVIGDPNIKQKMETRTLFGQGEHPEKTQSDLLLTSHIITKTFFEKINESGKDVERVLQEIDILSTPSGRIINTLIEANCALGVSTRAEGDLEEKDEKGKKYFRVIPESYHYVTTDFTADPSTYGTVPLSLEKRLVTEVMDGVHNKEVKERIPKLVAVSILEKLHTDEAKVAIKKIGEEKQCADSKECVCGGCGKCNEGQRYKVDFVNDEGEENSIVTTLMENPDMASEMVTKVYGAKKITKIVPADEEMLEEGKLIETSARVGVMKPDGTIQSVFCKWDGYPEGIGTTLESFYSDERKLEQLLSLGNVSALGKEIGEKHNFEERPKGSTTFYGRDRGDKDAGSMVSQNESEFRGLAKSKGDAYAYLFNEGKWRTMVLKESVKEVKDEKGYPLDKCDVCGNEVRAIDLRVVDGKRICDKCRELKKPETFEQVFNWDMAQLGLGVMIREGTYKGADGIKEVELKEKKKGKIVGISEGHVISLLLDDGTNITITDPVALSMSKATAGVDSQKDLVKQEEEEPEHKEETPEEVAAHEEGETEEEEAAEHTLESVDEKTMGIDYVRSLKGSVKAATVALKAKDYDKAAKELEDAEDDARDAARAAKKMKREGDKKDAAAKVKLEDEAEKEDKDDKKKDTKESIEEKTKPMFSNISIKKGDKYWNVMGYNEVDENYIILLTGDDEEEVLSRGKKIAEALGIEFKKDSVETKECCICLEPFDKLNENGMCEACKTESGEPTPEELDEAKKGKMPKGWTKKSTKKFMKTISGKGQHEKGQVSACIKKMTGKVSDPAAFCASREDIAAGTTKWRKGRKKTKEGIVNEDARPPADSVSELVVLVNDMLRMLRNVAKNSSDREAQKNINADADKLEDRLHDIEDDLGEEEDDKPGSHDEGSASRLAGYDESKVTESFDDMVKYIETKLSGASPNDVVRFGDLVKTKILNERVTPSTTSKEIRQLKIAEASTRAERDKAMELIDELESGKSSIDEQKVLEQKILTKKIEASTADVSALCSKIEEKQKRINEFNKVVEVNKKIVENLEKEHETRLVEQKKSLEENLQKTLVEKYIDIKINQSGLTVSQNARALLEKCSTIESVNETLEELKDAMRKDALRPGDIDKIQIKETKSREASVVTEQVQSIMSSMR